MTLIVLKDNILAVDSRLSSTNGDYKNKSQKLFTRDVKTTGVQLCWALSGKISFTSLFSKKILEATDEQITELCNHFISNTTSRWSIAFFKDLVEHEDYFEGEYGSGAIIIADHDGYRVFRICLPSCIEANTTNFTFFGGCGQTIAQVVEYYNPDLNAIEIIKETARFDQFVDDYVQYCHIGSTEIYLDSPQGSFLFPDAGNNSFRNLFLKQDKVKNNKK
jgi:hypothetical protein